MAAQIVELRDRVLRVETMQSQLSEYAQKLVKSNQELTDFAHIASHDLRAPIRNIGSFTQLLQRRLASQLDDRTKEYFDFITTNVRQSTKLIEDLLNYSKIDKNIGDPLPVDLNDALLLVRSNLQSFITEKKANIIAKDLPILRGHSSLIVQLFQNLINNGLKYNESEKPTVTIGSEWRRSDLVFSVSDNGIGILPQYREQVFGMFRRLHSSAQYEGSGIGLAFCQRIVSTYGGRIWIESEKEKGTIFYFTLPDTVAKKIKEVSPTFGSVQSDLLDTANMNDTEGGNQNDKKVFNGHARSKSLINPSTIESESAFIQFGSRKTTNTGVISECNAAPYSENATRPNATDLEPLLGKTKEKHFPNNPLPPSS